MDVRKAFRQTTGADRILSTSRKTFFTFLNKSFLSIISLLNSILLARFLLPGDRGWFQATQTYATFGTTLIGGYTGYYAYALSKDPEEAQPTVQMGNLFVFGVSLVTLGIAFALKSVLGSALSMMWWWAILCLPVGFVYNYGTKILQGINQIGWLNRANNAQPILWFAFTIGLYSEKYRLNELQRVHLAYALWVFSFALAAALTMLVSYGLLRNRKTIAWSFHPAKWRGTMRYGGWLSLSNAVNTLNYRVDFWFVQWLTTPTILSVYGIAVTASEVLVNISTSIGSVVFQRMTGGQRDDAIALTEAATRQTVLSSLLISVVMYIFFPALILLAYPRTYAGAVLPFCILLPGLIARSAGNLIIQYATNQLANPKVSIWMNGVSVLINAAACLIFVPILKGVGGAIASTVSYTISYAIYIGWFARVNQVSPGGLLWLRRSDWAPYGLLWRRVWRLTRLSRTPGP